MNGNGDAIDAINGVLTGKADKTTVYTKEEADAKHTATTNALNAEISRAQTKEGELQSAINTLNGNAETIGSVAHGVADAKHYTDDEISKLEAKVDASVTGFATKSEVANVDEKVDAIQIES